MEVGDSTLTLNITGTSNTAIGASALQNNTGSDNIGIGQAALFNNTTGNNNISIGSGALDDNTTENNNTAVGTAALQDNTQSGNTAIGAFAAQKNTTGGSIVAIGSNALNSNTTGSNLVAVGVNALQNNTTGSGVAVGVNALQNNTTGSGVAIGNSALLANTTGNLNVAVGNSALQALTGTTLNNTVIGNASALSSFNPPNNGVTAVGGTSLIANVSGANVAIGAQSLRETTDIAASFGAITGGSGYTDGTYSAVELVPTSYTRPYVSPFIQPNPIADITVAGGVVTVCTFVSGGSGIRVSSTLGINPATAPAGLLTGSGFGVVVATVTVGTQNTALGFDAGRLNVTGSRNVFLGYQAGRTETTNDNLYISNTNTSTPLIKGKFDSTGANGGSVRIHGDLQLTTKTPASASDTGITGTITWDADYIYICTATNTWKRVGIATW